MSTRHSRILAAFVLLGPAVIFLAVALGAAVYALSLGFFDLTQDMTWKFVGLHNYARALERSVVRAGLKNTLVFTAASATLSLAVGMVSAMFLNHPGLCLRGLWRFVLVVPWAVPPVTAAMAWRWVLDTRYGSLNGILIGLRLIREPIGWLTEPVLAMIALIVTYVWRSFPIATVMLVAAMQAIPDEQYEAACVDGAGSWQVFRHVTLPNVVPTLGVVGILQLIWSFKHFDTIRVLTDGGPGRETEVLSTIIYKEFFVNFRLGQASAIAGLMLVAMLLLALGYAWLTRRREAQA